MALQKKNMKNIKDILNMLDLFYANKHLYEKIQKKKENKRARGGGYHGAFAS